MPTNTRQVGKNTREILEDVPASLAAHFFQCVLKDVPGEFGDLAILSFLEDDPEARLPLNHLEDVSPELLAELEYHSQRVTELGTTTGAQSLKTIMADAASAEQRTAFESQVDKLSRSCWTFANLQQAFQNAESFHHARKDRERGNIYSTFSLDMADAIPASADTIDVDAVTKKVSSVLDLSRSPRLTVIDLPSTPQHPTSVMLIVRHGADLASVYSHQDDGSRGALYYRPQDEIILIYTPSAQLIEVLGKSFGERHSVSNAFAEVVLNHNVSEKPLSEKVYDLGRFANSFELEVPEVDDVEILSCVVTECELLLGSYGKRVSLKVTRSDDIDAIARRYLAGALRFRGSAGIYRVGISVEYRRPGETRHRSMNISVRGTNGSNVQSHKDRRLRELGSQLLKAWGISRALKPLDDHEAAISLPGLLKLFELAESVVTGIQISELGLSARELVDARLVSQKSKQGTTLVDEGNEVIEAEVPLDLRGWVSLDYTEYKVADGWLRETLAKTLSAGFPQRHFENAAADIVAIGAVLIDGVPTAVFLARRLNEPKVIDQVQDLLQSRNATGPSIILSTTPEAPRLIGRHTVMPVLEVWQPHSDQLRLDVSNLIQKYQSVRDLLDTVEQARIIRTGDHSGSFVMKEKEPLPLSTRIQIAFFEKLARAYNAGAPEVHSSVLIEGTSARSPREVFTGRRREIVFNDYVTKGQSGGWWRLKD